MVDSNFTTLPEPAENTYNGELNIHAIYFSSLINVIDNFLIVPGIRLEKFKQTINYDVINLGSKGKGFRKGYEMFLFPSLNVKYKLNKNKNIRFTFSKTVSVPEFKEVAPFTYSSISQRIVGNPDILQNPSFSDIYNLDLKYEWFLSRDELFSFSLFSKERNNPINKVVINDATGRQSYFRTGKKANVYGAEIELEKNIIKNTDEQTQLSIGFNLTYMKTKQDLRANQGSIFLVVFNKTK